MEEARYTHITLFNSAELRAYFSYFRNKLDDLYEFQAPSRINDLVEVLELLMVVVDTPRLAAQLNHIDNVSFTSMLEILMTKAAMWKVDGCKLLRQTASDLMQLVLRYAKPSSSQAPMQASSVAIVPQAFFVRGFQDSQPQKVQLFLSFLRIHLLNLFTRRQPIGEEWVPLVEVLVSLIKRLNSLLLIDSLVTVVSWMSQRNSRLKQCCLKNGLAYYLVEFIAQPDASCEFRKKCLKFIYFMVAEEDQAQKTLMQTDLEKNVMAFIEEYPFKGVEALMQPIIGAFLKFYQQADIDRRVSSTAANINEEELYKFWLYGYALKNQFSYSTVIKDQVSRRSRQLIGKQPSSTNDRELALCLKIVERYLLLENSSEAAFNELLRSVVEIVCSCLSRGSSRELTYQSIRTLTALVKKDSTRQKTVQLCKELNLKEKLPKEVEAQDIGMVLIIDRLLWLFKDRRQMKIEDFVCEILNPTASGKIDRAEQTSEKLTLVSELIRSGGKADVSTVNALINVLASQNASPVPQNSQEEELNTHVAKSRLEALAAIEAAYTSKPSEEFYEATVLNRLIGVLPAMQQHTETQLLTNILTASLPKCVNSEQLNIELFNNLTTKKPATNGERETEKQLKAQQSLPKVSNPAKEPLEMPKELTEAQIIAFAKSKERLADVLKYLESHQVPSKELLASLVDLYLNSESLTSTAEKFEEQLLRTFSANIDVVRDILSERSHFDDGTFKLWLALRLDPHAIMTLCADKLKHNIPPISGHLKLILQCLNGRTDYELFEHLELPLLLNRIDISDPIVLQQLSMLVHCTSKIKSIQRKYTLLQKLLEWFLRNESPKELLAVVLQALCGLTYDNQEAQMQVIKPEVVQHISKVAVGYIAEQTVVAPAMELVANLAMNPKNIEHLHSQQIVRTLLSEFEAYHKREEEPCQARKQIIRAIGNCSMHAPISRDLVKLNFLQLLKGALAAAIKHKNFEEVCYLFGVLLNILAHAEEEDGPEILNRVRKEGGLEMSIDTLRNFIVNADIVECCLQCISRLVGQVELESTVSASLVAILNSILKTHMWNQKIVQRCFDILGQLIKHKRTVEQIVDQSLPKTANEVICQPSFATNKDLQSEFVSLTHSLVKADRKKIFVESGVLDCLSRSLVFEKNPNPLVNLLKCAIDLVESNRSSAPINRELCVAVIDVLHNQSSQRVVTYGLKLLALLQQDLIIDKKACAWLIEFSSYFLTRSKQIMFETYELRVRDYLCLLACLVNRSSLLKIQMGNQAFLSILENWIKIAKAVETEGLLEAVRLVILTIVNKDNSFFQGTNNPNTNVHKAELELDSGYKCFLYRTDQSRKQACAAVRKGELIAYKLPSGEVKEKYHIPISNISLVVSTFKSNDLVYDNSVFYKAGGLFAKPPLVGNCVILAGVHNNRAKFLDLQFGSIAQKESFVAGLHSLALRPPTSQ